MNKRDEQKRERNLKRLAEAEGRIHTRLSHMRDEIDVIARQIDAVTVPRRKRRGLDALNLLPFSGGLMGRK